LCIKDSSGVDVIELLPFGNGNYIGEVLSPLDFKAPANGCDSDKVPHSRLRVPQHSGLKRILRIGWIPPPRSDEREMPCDYLSDNHS
jgi:hypothetical protein